jgi:hypothetical protein
LKEEKVGTDEKKHCIDPTGRVQLLSQLCWLVSTGPFAQNECLNTKSYQPYFHQPTKTFFYFQAGTYSTSIHLSMPQVAPFSSPELLEGQYPVSPAHQFDFPQQK